MKLVRPNLRMARANPVRPRDPPLVLHGYLLKQMFVIIDILVLAFQKNILVLYVTIGITGLLIWSVTLIGLLAGGALLVYNTSALAS